MIIEKDIIYEYMSGTSMKNIAKKYNTSSYTVKKILVNNNIRIRTQSECVRKYNINEEYFNEIDTKNKAYILGLLWSDGCNKLSKANVTIRLQKEDEHILMSIKKEMECEQPLYYRHGIQSHHKDVCSLEINSSKISHRLNELGMYPNKSLTLKYPNWLDEKLHSSFIRGLFDGDGCIKKYGYGATITGTYDVCIKVGEILTNQGIYNYVSHLKCNEITSTVFINKHLEAEKFFRWIYDDAELYIQRKYNLYLEKYINNSLSA